MRLQQALGITSAFIHHHPFMQDAWKQLQKEDGYRISGMVFNTFIFMQARP